MRLTKPTITRASLIPALLLLGACSGGGGSSSDTRSGALIDSPVAGISYTIGNKTRETDASGRFRYEKGDRLRFHVGDILLGEARGGASLTPVDLVPGAVDETNDAVTNICRFLQTLDLDANPANGIEISAATRLAALGASLDFAQSPAAFSASAGPVIAQLSTNALVTAAAAQAHFRGTLFALLSGLYKGHFDGDDRGSWRFVAYSGGQLVGYAHSTAEGGDPIGIWGSLNTDGSALISGSASTGASFSGSIDGDAISGTWFNSIWNESGTFEGDRYAPALTNLDSQLMDQLSGNYSGTVVDGNDSDPITIVVLDTGEVIISDTGDLIFCVVTAAGSDRVDFEGVQQEGYRIEGRIRDDGSLDGTWVNTIFGESGTFSATKD